MHKGGRHKEDCNAAAGKDMDKKWISIGSNPSYVNAINHRANYADESAFLLG
jgi:hypothetical protein